MTLIHLSLHIFNSDRESLVSEQAAAVISDEDVVFEADASEGVILFQCAEVDELGVGPFTFPLFYKCRDEINTWLNCHNVPFFEHLAHS